MQQPELGYWVRPPLAGDAHEGLTASLSWSFSQRPLQREICRQKKQTAVLLGSELPPLEAPGCQWKGHILGLWTTSPGWTRQPLRPLCAWVPLSSELIGGETGSSCWT